MLDGLEQLEQEIAYFLLLAGFVSDSGLRERLIALAENRKSELAALKAKLKSKSQASAGTGPGSLRTRR